MIRRAAFAAGLLAFSGWVVYDRGVDLYYLRADGTPLRALSLEFYRNTIAGVRPFPYQWRWLGNWVVRAGEWASGVDPHAVDAAVKTVLLAWSTYLLFLFAQTVVDRFGALMVAACYLLVTATAFASEMPAIYFANDYILMVGWFGAVYAAFRRRWLLVALAAFVTAWAKETAILIVILTAFEAWQGRATWKVVAVCAVAFAIPTMILRSTYRAPIGDWAWWHSATLNLPFLKSGLAALALVVRNNLKAILYLNVLWWLALRAWPRSATPFLRSLGATLLCYAAMAWLVVYIRELRHLLPFTILVLPLAVAEMQRLAGRPAEGGPTPQRAAPPSAET